MFEVYNYYLDSGAKSSPTLHAPPTQSNYDITNDDGQILLLTRITGEWPNLP